MKRFIDCYVPTETCNFRCHYCYIAQHRKFNAKLAKFDYQPEFIRKALSKKRLGGTCMFNICAGGETLLSEDVIKIIEQLLLEGHYVMVVTNGSLTNRFKEISNFDESLMKHLFFKFSFHFLELKRMGILDKFFENVKLMEKCGASYTIEITPTDELEPYIDEIKQICLKEVGAMPHITIGRKDSDDIPPLTNHTFDEYKKIWSQFDSEMFNFKAKIFGEKRKEFCYAGEWSVYLNLMTGEMRQCYCGKKLDNIYENVNKKLKFCPVGNSCGLPHCYNGHAFLTFGDIPELDTPTYDKLRNRVKDNGAEWLTKEMKEFMQSKLVDSNELKSGSKKALINIKNKPIMELKKIKRKIKHEKKK